MEKCKCGGVENCHFCGGTGEVEQNTHFIDAKNNLNPLREPFNQNIWQRKNKLSEILLDPKSYDELTFLKYKKYLENKIFEINSEYIRNDEKKEKLKFYQEEISAIVCILNDKLYSRTKKRYLRPKKKKVSLIKKKEQEAIKSIPSIFTKWRRTI